MLLSYGNKTRKIACGSACGFPGCGWVGLARLRYSGEGEKIGRIDDLVRGAACLTLDLFCTPLCACMGLGGWAWFGLVGGRLSWACGLVDCSS